MGTEINGIQNVMAQGLNHSQNLETLNTVTSEGMLYDKYNKLTDKRLGLRPPDADFHDDPKLINAISQEGASLAKYYSEHQDINTQKEKELFRNLEILVGRGGIRTSSPEQIKAVREFLKSSEAFKPNGEFNFDGLMQAYQPGFQIM